MDKASDSKPEDCRFKSCHDQKYFSLFFQALCKKVKIRYYVHYVPLPALPFEGSHFMVIFLTLINSCYTSGPPPWILDRQVTNQSAHCPSLATISLGQAVHNNLALFGLYHGQFGLWFAGLYISIENLYYSQAQSWNETTFPNLQITSDARYFVPSF